MKAIAVVIALLVACNALLAGAPATTRMASVQKLWEARLLKAGGKPIVSEHYPTEEALVFLTAYDFTRDPRYATQASLQLDYCHAREVNGLFVTSAKTTTRDYQARQIYNFYLAYRILADGRYLHWADDCAAAMAARIPRQSHPAAGETHTLFLAGYFTPDGKPHHETGNAIDPNQNAEVALAYTLLYHDPASKFFRDPLARSVAFDELLASMSIQNPQTGELPVHESMPDGFDTAYGSYAVFSWVWCQQLWHDERFEQHIRLAAKWLGPKTDLARDSQRWYPKRIENGVVPEWEANYRLPLIWHCNLANARSFAADLIGRGGEQPIYWAYFDLMGVPRSLFLGEAEAKTP